jgi:winged helix-turn-helix DNA-binding protein
MARTDFLKEQRKQITARLDELRPLYEEYLTLEKAQQALDQIGEPIRRAIDRGPGRPRTRRSRSGSATRRRSGNTRANQALAAIRANPGITIPELAEKLGIRPNYLYRVTAALQKERRIRRRGGGFHPT